MITTTVFSFSQDFAENLFKLFDYDNNGGVTLQELMGGLSQLNSKYIPYLDTDLLHA